jgi:methionyl-tRNA synthetase
MSETINTKPQNLSYDDFAKIDIRVGVVLAAESVPKSKKLLKLSVDFAESTGPRVILAGIAEGYSPESMLNRSIVAILNLAPRSMMGVESHGMLLAGRDVTGMVRLVDPNDIVKGSEIG